MLLAESFYSNAHLSGRPRIVDEEEPDEVIGELAPANPIKNAPKEPPMESGD